METVNFNYNGLAEDFKWKLDSDDLLTITCYHDVFKSTFGDYTKRFHYFGEMLELGKKKNREFFEAIAQGVKDSKTSVGKFP
jgi:hypothetical protein